MISYLQFHWYFTCVLIQFDNVQTLQGLQESAQVYFKQSFGGKQPQNKRSLPAQFFFSNERSS